MPVFSNFLNSVICTLDVPTLLLLLKFTFLNFCTFLVYKGTPMMLMGDEYGHTRYGNNNSYGHDTAINNFQWGQV